VKAAAAAVLAAAALLGPGSARASFPATHARILYAGESFIGLQLDLLDATTAAELDLGIPFSVRGGAAMAPDGATVAFTNTTISFPGEPPSQWHIFAGDVIGGFESVAQDSAPLSRPSWAPDGQSIVYASKHDGDWDIYRQTLDGVIPPVNLTASSPAADRNPRVGPDGRIAFESDRLGSVDVFTMAADGSGVRAVTAAPGRETLGDWSPDGSRIVYSGDASGAEQLYVVPAAGGTPARITHDSGNDTNAAWSPLGDRIAFSSDRDGDDDVYVVAPDGSAERQLTANSGEDLVQDWQALRDTTSPVVHALPGSGTRGKAFSLRFRVVEESGAADVEIDFAWRTAGGGGEAGTSDTVDTSNPQKVHSVRFPAELAQRLPHTIRFCVDAIDRSANESGPSCARFTFKPPPRRR
jgi:dipeptidyl aminopeptidase/acylaminoacyl peptidase